MTDLDKLPGSIPYEQMTEAQLKSRLNQLVYDRKLRGGSPGDLTDRAYREILKIRSILKGGM